MKQAEFLRAFAIDRSKSISASRHPFCPWFLLSVGMRELANTGCWWLIDLCAIELPQIIKQKNLPSALLKLESKDGLAKLSMWESETICVWERNVGCTDLPDGLFTFFITRETSLGSQSELMFRLILSNEFDR